MKKFIENAIQSLRMYLQKRKKERENAIQSLRMYLQEWKNEQEYAIQHGNQPEFSWHWHDKELVSIQRAIRATYEQVDAKGRRTLTKDEKAEVKKILSCVID